jgi:3-vinyl bacteriochlorophyllide hydratase
VVSIGVLALHTAYLLALLAEVGSPRDQMLLALAAYASYVVNAAQFVLKLRAARLEAPRVSPVAAGLEAAR